MIRFFKSLIDQDREPVVICDLRHTIVYMNPSAIARYQKWGGAALIGRSLYDCHNADSREKIDRVIHWFSEAPTNNRVHTTYIQRENTDVYMVALRDGEGALIGYYEKHEVRTLDQSGFYESIGSSTSDSTVG